jgi:exonuclease VII large subunit
MVMQPDQYLGQTVRVRGNFSYFQDPVTMKEYFAVIIADAAACCAQGIEFVWRGEHRYPDDYPPLETEMTVTGEFGTYEENGFTYLQLRNADVQWGK